MFDPTKPEAKHPSYDRLEQMRQLPGDLLGGLPGLLARKATYFPREIADGWPVVKNGITVDPYENRIGRLTLYNLFKEGINNQLVGRVFSKKVRWDDKTPVSLLGDAKAGKMGFLDDVDGRATNAHVFLRRRFRNGIARGMEGVLVEFSTADRVGDRSVEEDRKAGRRPYWKPYASGAVWDWRFAFVNGAERLVYLKLRDTWTDPATGETFPCLRIFLADGFSLVRFEVWREEKKAKGTKPTYLKVDEGVRAPHVEIPFVPFATDADDPMEAEPELVDAAWLNLAHCRKTGAVDNSQHQINFPMLAITGLSLADAKKQIEESGVGSHRAWVIPEPAGGISHAEPSGTSWKAAEETIDRVERRIEALLSKPLERDSRQPLTAQGEANSEAARMSRLESWVQGLTDSTNTLLYFTAIDLGEIKPGADGGWGAAEFNTKWTAAERDVNVVRLAYDLAREGKWPDSLAYQVAQEYGIAPEDVDFKELQKRLAEEPPSGAGRLFPVPMPGEERQDGDAAA